MEEIEDIIGLLKAKEGEMEELLKAARAKALRIKEDTVAMAAEVKAKATSDMVTEAGRLRTEEAARLALEVSRIEERGKADAQKLGQRARTKKDEAVRLVFEALTGGVTTSRQGVQGGKTKVKTGGKK